MCGEDQEIDPIAGQPTDDFPWHIGVFDAHNHIGERMLTVADIPTMRSRCLAIMATRTQDQPLVATVARSSLGLARVSELSQEGLTTVIPGFGRHPWFSHELFDDTVDTPTFDVVLAGKDLARAKMRHYAAVLTPSPPEAAFVADLPTPSPLTQFMQETKEYLDDFPLAMVGEIGLDKAFRLPGPWDEATRAAVDPARTPGGRNRRPLSRHNITLEHQKTVLMAHLKLAGEMKRAVSVHGVQVHGNLYDLLVNCWKGHEKKGKRRSNKTETRNDGDKDTGLPYPPRICLHSFSGKSEGVRQYLNPKFPADIFFSFSKTNNLRDDIGRAKFEDALTMVPDDRILVESDIHTAGKRMDLELKETYRAICKLKGWELEEGVARVAKNWEHFVFGSRGSVQRE